MYYLERKDDINDVSDEFWQLNQNTFSKLYRTKEWFTDSQTRLGDKSLYLECYYFDQPIMLIPLVIFEKISSYPPVDPHKMVESFLNISIINEPVAISISLFGLGCPILVKRNDIDWDEVIFKVREILKEKYNCNYLVFSFLSENDDPVLIDKITRTRYGILPHKKYGVLNIKKYANFKDYIGKLKRTARQAYNKEKLLHSANSIEVKQTKIYEYSFDLLGQLASNVYKKYGSDVNFERLSSFASYINNTFKNSGLFVSLRNDIILSYAMYVEYEKVLYVKMLGRNYEDDMYSTYFASTYYLPIQYSFKNNIEYINYGSGSIETKTKRNVDAINSYSYVFY